MYFWQNELKKESESILLLKTTEKNAKIVEKRIKQLHSYELPCILKLTCDANEEFEEWADEPTSGNI